MLGANTACSREGLRFFLIITVIGAARVFADVPVSGDAHPETATIDQFMTKYVEEHARSRRRSRSRSRDMAN